MNFEDHIRQAEKAYADKLDEPRRQIQREKEWIAKENLQFAEECKRQIAEIESRVYYIFPGDQTATLPNTYQYIGSPFEREMPEGGEKIRFSEKAYRHEESGDFLTIRGRTVRIHTWERRDTWFYIKQWDLTVHVQMLDDDEQLRHWKEKLSKIGPEYPRKWEPPHQRSTASLI